MMKKASKPASGKKKNKTTASFKHINRQNHDESLSDFVFSVFVLFLFTLPLPLLPLTSHCHCHRARTPTTTNKPSARK